jgi:hypothetical protein
VRIFCLRKQRCRDIFNKDLSPFYVGDNAAFEVELSVQFLARIRMFTKAVKSLENGPKAGMLSLLAYVASLDDQLHFYVLLHVSFCA